MTKIIINKFDKGQAEDIRTTSINQNALSQNFDVFTNPHKLKPYSDSITETASVAINDSRISDIVTAKVVATDYIVGIGYESSISNTITFYTKTSITGSFSKQASATGNSFVQGSGITYKNQAYAVDSNGSGSYRFIRFNGAGALTTIGTITATVGKQAKCFVHPEDNVLYILIANVISKWDGTTFSTHTSILPTDFSVSSMTSYGSYLAITMNSDIDNINPVCYLWGRDTSINTLQGNIDLGEGYVGIVENLNNNLIFVMSPDDTFNTTVNKKIIIKGYTGGTVEILKEILDESSLSIGQVQTYKAKKNNRLYFGFRNSDCIWTFGKNKSGNYILNQDRFEINGTQISGNPNNQSMNGISIIGDIIWVGGISQIGIYTLMRSKGISEGLSYTSSSKYKTTINPNMPINDRDEKKQLKKIRVLYTGASSGTTTIKYSTDGGSLATIQSNTNATGEQIFEAGKESDGTPLNTGREFQFQIESTGGSQIKEIIYEYEVIKTT